MPFFEANDQTQLFYTDWGRGKPILFAHAWAMNAAMWEYHMLYFNDHGMRCIAYDRRGHGRSDRPGHGYHYDQHADDLACLIELLNLQEVTLVGHSMGGGEIIRYLTRYGSDRFRAELQNVNVPTLLIHGDQDQSVAVDFGRKTANLLPRCQYKEYRGAPHGLFFTHMDTMNQDILSFLRN